MWLTASGFMVWLNPIWLWNWSMRLFRYFMSVAFVPLLAPFPYDVSLLFSMMIYLFVICLS